MDSKTFTARLSKALGCDHQHASAMTAALTAAIAEAGAELDSAAIPGFGTFEGVKHDEEITNDLTTGKRMLLPPSVEVKFVAGSMLKKKLKEGLI